MLRQCLDGVTKKFNIPAIAELVLSLTKLETDMDTSGWHQTQSPSWVICTHSRTGFPDNDMEVLERLKDMYDIFVASMEACSKALKTGFEDPGSHEFIVHHRIL